METAASVQETLGTDPVLNLPVRNGNNPALAISVLAKSVLNLPVRNGNAADWAGIEPVAFVLNLPVRNGNTPPRTG